MPVRVRDRGAAKLVASMPKKVMRVSVGIIGQGARAITDSGALVSEVAAWMEFGTDKVPERSFIRGYVDENDKLIKDKLRGAAKLVLKGKTLRQALGLVGLFIEEGIRDRIDAGIDPALKDATVADKRRKGYPKPGTPLVGTRQLYASITHEVS